MTGTEPRRVALQVAIVSNNAETLDGLQAYLGNAGVHCQTTRSIHDFTMATRLSTTSAIVFPDDFADLDVFGWVREVWRKRPQLLAVLVTREPSRIRAGFERDASRIVVLPRPSFGWEILDAIRRHAPARGPEPR